MEEKRVALIAVIVDDISANDKIQQILHEYAGYIIGRMGIPYHARNISLISVAIDAPSETINALCGKLGKLENVSTKAVFAKTQH